MPDARTWRWKIEVAAMVKDVPGWAQMQVWGARGWRAAGWLWARAPRWALQWQFWLTLAVGAFLRLYWLGHSPFYSDSALLYLEVARGAHDHLLPGTGIYNSLLALNMPLYTLLMYPFANNPQGWTLLQAAANVVAVALLYIWAERAFGRWAALIGGLLFATALYDTYMSDFIWQNCLLLPLIIGALYTLHLGIVERQRHWFIPHALIMAAMIQIHPVTVVFLPLTLLGLALGWQAVSWYDFYIGIAGAAALYIPTTLFEIASNGYDLPIYLAYLSAPRTLDGQTIQQISDALGPRPFDWLGVGTRYASAAQALPWLGPLVDVLVVASLIWLTLMLIGAPLARLVTWARQRFTGANPTEAEPDASSASTGAPAVLTLPAGAAVEDTWWPWRAWLLVVSAPLIFVALTLRHASPLYVHYVFVATPPLYVAVGAFLVGLVAQVRWATRWLRRTVFPTVSPVDEWQTRLWALGRVAPVGILAGVAVVVIVAQVVLTGAYTLTFASGESPASTWGAIPTTSYTAALDATQRAASGLHARQVYLAGDPSDPFMALYWAQRQNNLAGSNGPLWTAYSSDQCALTPPTGGSSAATLVMGEPGSAVQELLSAPGTRELGRLTLARDATYPLYAIAPNTAAPSAAGIAVANGELRLDRAFTVAAGNGQPARLVTLWTSLRSTPPGPAVAIYRFHFLFQGASGGLLSVFTTCAPGSWVAGEGAVVVTPLPSGARAEVAPFALVSRETHSWWRPQIGDHTLETAKELISEPVVLPLSNAYGDGLARPTQAQLDAATITVPLSPGW